MITPQPTPPASTVPQPRTVVHVTHEAIDHLGGIGTVLAGLITSDRYRATVARSLLVGPLQYPDRATHDPRTRLGEHAVACHYSGPEHHDPHHLGALLQPVEWAFGTRIVYGTRTFHRPGDESVTAEAEVLLIDVSNPDRNRLAMLKWWLFEHHRIESNRYEHSWDFEEYTRLAGPAYHAVAALLGQAPSGVARTAGPAVLIAHEFMGVPTALRAGADRERFRTLFHAHECSTGRRLTEDHPGMDAAFYPAMNRAMEKGESVGEVFGDQSAHPRHALISRAHVLDGVMAVGPETADELRFLSPQMRESRTRVVYNGLPARKVTLADKKGSRSLVDAYLHKTLGFAPDYLITHVTRPVPSKGLWRDLTLCRHLASHLAESGRTAVYLLLTAAAPTRTRAQVEDMSARYGWPLAHQQGFPDLVGPEVDLYHQMQSFNVHVDSTGKRKGGQPRPVTALLINQFGFSADRLGAHAPAGLTTADLRRAADAELGMSTYEPFGIAQLEPLHAGAVCVTSTVCGCMGLVQRAMKHAKLETCDVVIPADFVSDKTLAPGHEPVEALALTAAQRLEHEDRVCGRLAELLAQKLPKSDADRERLLKQGQTLAPLMSWEAVVESDFMPAIEEALRQR
ncbi:MAG TPA: hypothetical protein VEB22_05720 [Phycisphaerales bacterium]|nr:hypothetical protein [Phycisphaerales bacterium]